MKIVKDKSGREIVIGDYIVYGHALGRCAGLKYGKVLGFKELKQSYYSEETKIGLSVIGIEDDWSSQDPKLGQRKGFLQFPEERVLLVYPEQLPEGYKDLLDNFKI
jgi:hypothetical protein